MNVVKSAKAADEKDKHMLMEDTLRKDMRKKEAEVFFEEKREIDSFDADFYEY